jgi:hypothetical protein
MRSHETSPAGEFTSVHALRIPAPTVSIAAVFHHSGEAPRPQRSANSPQEVRPRPILADSVQRSPERVYAGQAVFFGVSQR